MPRREPKALNHAICLGNVWPSLGGKGTVVVFSPSSEGWSASSTDDWISGFTSERVPGYSSFTFEIAKNRGSGRTGTIRVTRPELAISRSLFTSVVAASLFKRRR